MLIKFKKISALAKTSFGIPFVWIAFQEKQVSDVEAQLSKLLEKFKTPITIIPAIGDVIGATILGEVGDINRFNSGANLLLILELMPLFHNLENMK